MSSGSANERLKAILKAGNLFEGKYRIVRPLGAGSFAVVVHARHEVMKRDVALKFLKPKVVASNPEVSTRFIKEVQIAAKLRHKNVVTIFDFGKTGDGIYYMVQEFVDGATLDELLPPGVPMDEGRAVDVISQVLACLQEAHNNNIIHRDLKPSNLMSTRHPDTGAEVIKVLDFGVAKLLEDQGRGSGPVRQSTKFIGTPIYMSPEQILGQEVSAASDLYSVGLMLYELMTGDPPIQAEQVAEVVQQHLSDQPFAFPKLAFLPEHTKKVILHATARKPESRFSSAAEFTRALADPEFLYEEEEPADEVSVVTPAQMSLHRTGDALDDVFLGNNYISMNDDDYGNSEFDPGGGFLSHQDDKVIVSPSFQPTSAPGSSQPGRRLPTSPASSQPGRRRTDPSAPSRPAGVTNSSSSMFEMDGSAESFSDSDSDSTVRALGGGEIELDMDVMRSVQQKRRSGTAAPAATGSSAFTAPTKKPRKPLRTETRALSPGEQLGRWVLYISSFFAFFASFIIASALLDGSASGLRYLVGVSPLILAIGWTAGFIDPTSDVGERWAKPIAWRGWGFFALLLLGSMFIFPGRAKISLKHEAAWFVQEDPTSAIYSLANAVGKPVAKICARMDATLYGAQESDTLEMPPGEGPLDDLLLE